MTIITCVICCRTSFIGKEVISICYRKLWAVVSPFCLQNILCTFRKMATVIFLFPERKIITDELSKKSAFLFVKYGEISLYFFFTL